MITPQVYELKIITNGVLHAVHDDIPEINEYPFALGLPLDSNDIQSIFACLTHDLVGHRAGLAIRCPRRDKDLMKEADQWVAIRGAYVVLFVILTVLLLDL